MRAISSASGMILNSVGCVMVVYSFKPFALPGSKGDSASSYSIFPGSIPDYPLGLLPTTAAPSCSGAAGLLLGHLLDGVHQEVARTLPFGALVAAVVKPSQTP